MPMGDIQFGVSLSEPFSLREAANVAQTVEGLGFDSLWLTENVRPGTAELEPLITLGIFAVHTSRVSIGPGVVILPLRNPIGLAHAAATLDRLSGGRLILGVGAGEKLTGPFQAYGVPVQERGRRCDEALEIMKRLWTGKSASFHGRFWSFEDYTLGLRPVQVPHLPIWFAGARAESVVKRTARFGDGIFPSRTTPSDLASVFERIDEYRREYGRDGSPFVKAMYLRLCLGETVEEARSVFKQALEKRYKAPIAVGDPPGGPPSGGGAYLRFSIYELVGTPEYCIENIQRYAEAGATHIVLDTSCPTDQIIPQLKTFAKKVMPRFR